ncbi:MAG: hypothetical protein GQ564_19910 [Bacteroidales bacterium]|nr:hypothetical protein [Bacteroidales bacterium]
MEKIEPVTIEFPEEVLFIFLYLSKRKRKKATINQTVLELNDINFSISEIKENLYFKTFKETYFDIIKETDNSVTLKLTKAGIELLPYIVYERKIIRYNFFVKLVIVFYKIDKLISRFVKKYLFKQKSPLQIIFRVISWIILAILSSLIGIYIAKLIENS